MLVSFRKILVAAGDVAQRAGVDLTFAPDRRDSAVHAMVTVLLCGSKPQLSLPVLVKPRVWLIQPRFHQCVAHLF